MSKVDSAKQGDIRRPRSRFTDEYGLLLNRLVETRKAAGIPQAEVAKRLGKSQSHVSMCENREREISIIDLLHWCHALGLGFGQFASDFEQEIAQWPRFQKPKQ